jgi:hypothetical protein
MQRKLLQIIQTLKNMKIFKVICNSSFKFNIISFIVITIIIYRFYLVLNFDIGLLSLIISFLISLLLTNFVLNKFEYSKNIYIGFIQRFLIYTFIYIMLAVLLVYILKISNLIPNIYCSSAPDECSSILNGGEGSKDVVKITSCSATDGNKDEYYKFKIRKDLFDEGLKNVADASKMALEKIAPNLGVGAAAGSAASAAIKYTAGMGPLQRLAVIGSSAVVTAGGTKIGLDVGGAISKNMNIEEAIKNSPHADPQVDRIPSPDIFIHSPLEETSPLQDLLMYSLALDIFILLLLIGILIVIFNRYIVKYNIELINSIIQRSGVALHKYMPIKIINWLNLLNKNRAGIINSSIDYNNKLVLFIFIINGIFIFLFVLLKIFISSELLIHIDSYINVHNYIHGGKGKESSSIALLLLSKNTAFGTLGKKWKGALARGKQSIL